MNPPTHAADLIERHSVWVAPPAPNMHPDGVAAAAHRSRAWEYCNHVAEQWALDNDLVIETEAFENQDEQGKPIAWGVRWTIVVGVGTEAVSPDTAPPTPWSWSERWRTWLVAFRHMDRPRLTALPGGKVITINRGRRS